jgi:hypothetical protein
MNSLCITVSPARDQNDLPRPGWFCVYADIEDQLFGSELCVSQDPLRDAARHFLRTGMPRETRISLQHGDFFIRTWLGAAAQEALFPGHNIVDFTRERIRRRWMP